VIVVSFSPLVLSLGLIDIPSCEADVWKCSYVNYMLGYPLISRKVVDEHCNLDTARSTPFSRILNRYE